MWKDPIVDEIRKAREAHAAKFGYDLQAIYRDLKEQERNSGRKFVSYPARSCEPDSETTTKQGAQPNQRTKPGP